MKEAMMFIVRYPLAWVVVKKLVFSGDIFGAEQVASEYLGRALTNPELRRLDTVCWKRGDITGALATGLRFIEQVQREARKDLRTMRRLRLVH